MHIYYFFLSLGLGNSTGAESTALFSSAEASDCPNLDRSRSLSFTILQPDNDSYVLLAETEHRKRKGYLEIWTVGWSYRRFNWVSLKSNVRQGHSLGHRHTEVMRDDCSIGGILIKLETKSKDMRQDACFSRWGGLMTAHVSFTLVCGKTRDSPQWIPGGLRKSW